MAGVARPGGGRVLKVDELHPLERGEVQDVQVAHIHCVVHAEEPGAGATAVVEDLVGAVVGCGCGDSAGVHSLPGDLAGGFLDVPFVASDVVDPDFLFTGLEEGGDIG